MINLAGKSILLVISGGIAAYKALELIRLLRKSRAEVRCILTEGGAEFVTALSVSALSEHPVYTDLFSLKDESEMGHIRLSREADVIVIAPASADLMAKMANGIADDLASTTLLASNKPIFAAPAMNPEMWEKPSTQRNIETLRADGIRFIGPASGEMACGETGLGRMIEPEEIFEAVSSYLKIDAPLAGKKVLVTSGPTYEPIDPVRFIGNRSSGKQGHAIAAALTRAGADVTLVTGPVALSDPPSARTIHIETATEMLAACQSILPVDIAICAAAVADWRVENAASNKIKKQAGSNGLSLSFAENPDILAEISKSPNRPALVIGFAAETQDVIKSAQEKLVRKGCDWILANQVGKTDNPVFGTDHNQVTLVSRSNCDEWPPLSKKEVSSRLVEAIISHFNDTGINKDDKPNSRTLSSAS
ncbi:MAG: bifunctional phosphopantothenoylcysteine decarboxylase/phosphopantothenate--cysteine ligase CoaBC [Pseudobdellovibrionaceae bacterium]|jgi:phosphopantothenoylcysteine decarboxylase/phosphopantothenate--cysteine ligase|nr:bifunctional phosphopantothenoylcysteine decarboxylase/phosphopantothenate--cysteine ligase CoaBC [Pseudobdellovibrionaceae bacterium]